MSIDPKHRNVLEQNPDDGLDDRVLMVRIRQHDQQALAILYSRYGNMIYGLALHILRQQTLAEEVAQDVFMRVWERAIQWDAERSKLATWLLAMTRNAAIDRLRKENRRPALVEASMEKVLSMAPVEAWQAGHQLRMLIQQLPAEQQQILHLSFYGGMSQRDIADTMDIPLGTVKTRMRLGLQKLRQMWMEK